MIREGLRALNTGLNGTSIIPLINLNSVHNLNSGYDTLRFQSSNINE